MVDCAKEFLQTDPKKAEESFLESAELFENIEGGQKFAAKSYFAIKQYEKAKPLFVMAQEFNEAGECILKILGTNPEHPNKMDLYKEALEYFEKGGNHGKAEQVRKVLGSFEKI